MQLTLISNSKSGSPWAGEIASWRRLLTFRVDSEGYLFLNLKRSGASRWRGLPYIPETHCAPAVIHGNGGAKMDISRPTRWADPVLDKRAFEYVEHVPGVLAMPFLDPAWCSQVVGAAVGLDLWEPLAGDKVPGDELRLRALDCWLFEWLDKELADSVKPIIDRRWFPSRWSNIRDSFFIRYSADRQPEIRLHEDSSHFSCSVKMRKTLLWRGIVFSAAKLYRSVDPAGLAAGLAVSDHASASSNAGGRQGRSGVPGGLDEAIGGGRHEEISAA